MPWTHQYFLAVQQIPERLMPLRPAASCVFDNVWAFAMQPPIISLKLGSWPVYYHIHHICFLITHQRWPVLKPGQACQTGCLKYRGDHEPAHPSAEKYGCVFEDVLRFLVIADVVRCRASTTSRSQPRGTTSRSRQSAWRFLVARLMDTASPRVARIAHVIDLLGRWRSLRGRDLRPEYHNKMRPCAAWRYPESYNLRLRPGQLPLSRKAISRPWSEWAAAASGDGAGQVACLDGVERGAANTHIAALGQTAGPIPHCLQHMPAPPIFAGNHVVGARKSGADAQFFRADQHLLCGRVG